MSCIFISGASGVSNGPPSSPYQVRTSTQGPTISFALEGEGVRGYVDVNLSSSINIATHTDIVWNSQPSDPRRRVGTSHLPHRTQSPYSRWPQILAAMFAVQLQPTRQAGLILCCAVECWRCICYQQVTRSRSIWLGLDIICCKGFVFCSGRVERYVRLNPPPI